MRVNYVKLSKKKKKLPKHCSLRLPLKRILKFHYLILDKNYKEGSILKKKINLEITVFEMWSFFFSFKFSELDHLKIRFF